MELADLLRARLPGQPVSGVAWYRTKHLLVPLMVLACLSIITAGWLASKPATFGVLLLANDAI